ncbi:hypothetical protein GCM10029976_093020 [Kribbella albertanoniae]
MTKHCQLARLPLNSLFVSPCSNPSAPKKTSRKPDAARSRAREPTVARASSDRHVGILFGEWDWVTLASQRRRREATVDDRLIGGLA